MSLSGSIVSLMRNLDDLEIHRNANRDISCQMKNSLNHPPNNPLPPTVVDRLSDKKIIDSWHTNASPWITAVREGQIPSRRLVTDQAILDAVCGCNPASVLDIGCGEGWLVRALAERGIRALGVDAVPGLIDAARAGGGDYRLLSYDELAAGALHDTFDLLVCNFSLLGEASVEGLVAAAPSLLNAGGALVVQTLHPLTASGDLPYRDGWREGSWAGFSDDFSDPAPWYFRTLESWVALFVGNGFIVREIREPLHPDTGRPASALFVLERG